MINITNVHGLEHNAVRKEHLLMSHLAAIVNSLPHIQPLTTVFQTEYHTTKLHQYSLICGNILPTL